MLRLKVSGLDDTTRVAALTRSLGLVANVEGVRVDRAEGEVVVEGDVDEHLVLIHLANEGFDARAVHDPA